MEVRDAAFKIILRQTKRFTDINVADKVDESVVLSPKGRDIVQYLNKAGTVEDKHTLAFMFGILLEEDLTPHLNQHRPGDNYLTDVQYALVVPLENNNGHNYDLGSPVLIARPPPNGFEGLMRSTGAVGNTFDAGVRLGEYVRPATADEIEGFLAVFDQASLDRVFAPFMAVLED